MTAVFCTAQNLEVSFFQRELLPVGKELDSEATIGQQSRYSSRLAIQVGRIL